MNEYKITFSDGNYFYTRFNGTLDDAKQYYLGHIFNNGTVSDHMVKCVAVEQVNVESSEASNA